MSKLWKLFNYLFQFFRALFQYEAFEFLIVLQDYVCVCVFAGMDLFEEALRRWEEALTFRSRQADDDASCASVKTGAGDAIAEQGMEVNTTTHL